MEYDLVNITNNQFVDAVVIMQVGNVKSLLYVFIGINKLRWLLWRYWLPFFFALPL